MRFLRTKILSASIATLTFGSVSFAFASTSPMNGVPFTPASWPFVYNQTTSTSNITSGVEQQTSHFDTVDGPLQANVLSVDLTNPNVKMGVVLANNEVYSKDETVSSMAARTGAVGGVNGDFFEMGASGRPENLCISNGTVLQSQLPGGYAVIGVTTDGRITVGPESFQGQVTVTSYTYGTGTDGAITSVTPPATNGSGVASTSGGSGQTVTSSTYGPGQPSSFPLVAVNRPGQEAHGQIGLITPAMGSMVYVKGDTAAYLVPVAGSSATFQVLSVQQGVKAISHLTNEVALIAGGGAAANWLTQNLLPGDIVTVSEGLSPDNNLVQAVGSGYQLLKNGQWYSDPHALGTFAVNEHNPLTAVGVTRDGQHAFMVVFDGRKPASVSIGLTYHQMAAYLQHLGAWNAAMLDGGGSTEMVAREPGNQSVSVLNSPSDGHERSVANGLFVYSTEPSPGPASQVMVNGGLSISMMVGATTTVHPYAVDLVGNPAVGSVSLSVAPTTLATVIGNQVNAQQAGTGELIATASNGVTSSVPLTVVTHPSSVRLTPSQVNAVPGQTTHFTATALDANGQTVLLPAGAVQWTTSKTTIGSISKTGLFQAAVPQSPSSRFPSPGDVTVEASIGGLIGQASVHIGYTSTLLESMTVLSHWLISPKADGKITVNRYQRAHTGDKGSFRIAYDYPAGHGSAQVVFWPKDTMKVSANRAGDAPSGLGFWVKGDNSNVNMAVSVITAGGSRVTLYPGKVNFSGWKFVTVPFPSGLGSSITVSFLDFLVVNPAKELKGTLYVSDLQALYPSTPSVRNGSTPAWFQGVKSLNQFKPGGMTMVATDGARISGADPKDARATAITSLASDLQSDFPSQRVRKSLQIQLLGNMVAQGTPADYHGLKTLLGRFGLPIHAAVGPTEIAASAENDAFRKAFGATHYAYSAGGSSVIVLDDAHGGVLASDSAQSPAGQQFSWLSHMLAATHAKTVFIVANEPAFSQTPGDGAAIINRVDANLLEQLAENYQIANSNAHVVLLFQGATGPSFRQTNPSGQEVSGNGVMTVYIPPLSTADGHTVTGATYLLLHAASDGTVQWASMPIHDANHVATKAKSAGILQNH